MASRAAAHEPGSIADVGVPPSIFAPDPGVCGDDAADESFEDPDMVNGELRDAGVDFTNKVELGLGRDGAAQLTLAAPANK